MTTASTPVERRMSVAEFLVWSEEQPDDARYAPVAGVPVRLMAPTSIRHARIQRKASETLSAAVAAAGIHCEVLEAGPGVALGPESDECRIPDVVVTCSATIDETSYLVPEAVIVVEVASPPTRLADVNDKVEFHGSIPSIHHYLVVEQDRRRVVYHGRGASGGLEPKIVREGEITLNPPGIVLALDALYSDTTLPTP